jgi:hypothetical protein
LLRSTARETASQGDGAPRWSEDEAVALISPGVDFGVTQVADGNWGVHAIDRKQMFR